MAKTRLVNWDAIGTLITLTKEDKLDNFIIHNVETGATLRQGAKHARARRGRMKVSVLDVSIGKQRELTVKQLLAAFCTGSRIFY